MNLEMKNIKHFASGSEETYCYTATVYLDGKPFSLVSNNGHGGCDSDYSHDKFKGDYRETMKKVDDYFKSLPNTDPCKYFPEGMEQTFELWCGEQVTSFLYKKDLKRALKKNKVVYRKDKEGKMGLYDYDIRYESESLKRHFPDAVILNDVSFDDAMNIWRGYFDA